MTDAALWEARSRAFACLGRFLLAPTQADAEALGLSAPGDPDELAAAHHAALDRGLFPYESVFLGDRVQLGGDLAAAVAGRYAACGWRDTSEVEPDHLGVELAFAAFLAGATADAHADARPRDAARCAALLEQFLAAHLLRWLPPVVVALEGQPLWGDAATLAWELGLSLVSAPAPALPDPPDVLGDPSAGLLRVAGALLVPAFAGGFLTGVDLDAISRATEVPSGFGARLDRLEALLKNAADLRAVDRVAAALEARIARWTASYAALGAPGWAARSEVGRAVVARLADARAKA